MTAITQIKGRVSEEAPGVYQIRGARLSSNAYLLKGKMVTALVDPGGEAGIPALLDGLRQIGLNPQDIQLVINTHEHFDHVGGNRAFGGSTLFAAHYSAARKITESDRFVTMLEQAGEPWRINFLFRDGAELDLGGLTLQVIHTPGHTSGSVSLYEPSQRLLFSGDTLFAGGVLSYIAESGSFGDYIASIQRLATLRLSKCLPGHGRISEDPYRDLANAEDAARRLLRREEVPVRTRIQEL